ncbi:hypothetical protein P879_00963 [Paragonimus westermani]|uniref:Uncharacterized protein n=1 Tax=Paragonimus westermani TaxID=34504 RepID=A0A8T0DTG7_9TREM|nr:hypothetical protein P879_00963 [Paragonimus westermani]
MKLLDKFLRTAKSKSSVNSPAVDVHGNCKCLPDKTHVKEFYIGQNQKLFVDVEVFPMCEVVRIYGVNETYTCADFAVTVCRLIDLQPTHYTLMIRDIGAPMSWRCAPPNGILMRYVESLSYYNRETNNCIFRLVEKSHIEEITKPHLLTSRSANRLVPNHPKALKHQEPISGLELLKQFGTRVLVFLPDERKSVVRAQLNRPVLEAVTEVCVRQNLCPGDYLLCNPRDAVPIDPQRTFESQGICEFQLKACNPECSNLSFLVDVVASMRRRNTTACTSPTGLRTRHQSADTHMSTPHYFRPRSLTVSSAYATTDPSFLSSTNSPRETLTSMDASGCAPLYRVGERSPRTVVSKYRKKRMAPPPPPLPPSLLPAVIDVVHSTSLHSTSVFATNNGGTSREHMSPSALRIRKKSSSSWSTSELSPRSVYFSSRPVSDSVGRSKSFDRFQMNSVDLDHTLSNPDGDRCVSESHLVTSSLSLHTLPKNEPTVDSSDSLPIPQTSDGLGEHHSDRSVTLIGEQSNVDVVSLDNRSSICCSELPSLVEHARGPNVEKSSSESLPLPHISVESSIHENSVQSSALQPLSKTHKPAVAPRPSAELLAKHLAHRHTLNLWVPNAVSPIDMHHSAEFTDELKRVTSRYL